jgi:hypothetical protein
METGIRLLPNGRRGTFGWALSAADTDDSKPIAAAVAAAVFKNPRRDKSVGFIRPPFIGMEKPVVFDTGPRKGFEIVYNIGAFFGVVKKKDRIVKTKSVKE